MKLPFLSLRFGYDTYERHRLIASQIGFKRKQSILDVGGKPGLLAQFLGCPVTMTNMSEGDVVSNGLFLPFADSAFEIVTSLDVLEHIPPASRSQFIAELLRVATSQVVFCVPLGSLEHSQREKGIWELLLRKGISNPMLEEHVALGLPSQHDILSYVPSDSKYRIIYSGDFRFNGLLFQVDQKFVNMRILKPIGFLISIILNLVGNALIYPFYLSSKAHKFTNRIAVILSKEPNDC